MRLRDLQRRAFAPGGGLTDAEAAELRALTAQASVARSAQWSGAVSAEPAPSGHRAGSAGGPHAVVAPGGEAALTSQETAADASGTHEAAHAHDGPAIRMPLGAEQPLPALPAGPGASPAPLPSGSEGKEPPEPAASGSRRRAGLSIVAAAATLLLGFGAGWLMFGRYSGPQMTAEQQKTYAEIESSNEYDAGSLQYVGSRDELSVWQATDSDREQRCIVLTAGDQKEHTCIPSSEDLSAWSLQASLSITGPDGVPKAAFWATILEDVDGNPVTAIQRHDMSEMGQFDWRDNFVGTEREIAEVIDSQGYDGEMLSVIGYDGDVPIWLQDSAMPCIVIADTERLLMANCGEYSPEGVLEVEDNGVLYSVKQTENRGPMLTITRTGTTPPDQGGEQIDDRTGEVVE